MNRRPRAEQEQPQPQSQSIGSRSTKFGLLWKRVWTSLRSTSCAGEGRPQHQPASMSLWTKVGLRWRRIWTLFRSRSGTREDEPQHEPCTLPHIMLDDDIQISSPSDPSSQYGKQEQPNEETFGSEDHPQDGPSFSTPPKGHEKEKKSEYDDNSHGDLSSPEQGGEGEPAPEDQSQAVSSLSASVTHTDKNEEFIITNIRATGLTLGLRRLPAGFYITVHHSDLKWRTENKRSSVNDDVEWIAPIPLPSDLSAIVCLEVYASFEFQPMLGAGEHLRKLTTTANTLVDRSEQQIPFTFFPKDGDVVSPCSSIIVGVKRLNGESSGSSLSGVLGPFCSITDTPDELEDTTNRGHNALLCYQKYGRKQDLERCIGEFESALNTCPPDHPCHAATQSNLAMAKFILCQVEDTNISFKVPLDLYHTTLAARPVGHADRPSTLTQLAAVHLACFEKQKNKIDGAQVETLLHEVMELGSFDCHEERAVSFMLQLHAAYTVGPDGASNQPMADSWSRLADEDPWDFSVQLLKRFERYGDLADLQQAITLLQTLVRSASVINEQYRKGLGNFGVAMLWRFQHLGELSDLEDAIATHRRIVDLTPDGSSDKPGCLNNLGLSLRTRFERLWELSDLEHAVLVHKDAVDLTPDGHPLKPAFLNNLGLSFITRFERLGELSDLEHAISIHRDAVDLTPDGQPEKPQLLNNLGLSFIFRFDRLGELSDLEHAISTHRSAVHLIPDGQSNKPTILNNLGLSFKTRFERLGELNDLEHAISTLRDTVDLTPDGHPEKPRHLNNLGLSLKARYRRLGELTDLEHAISTHRGAVSLMPDGHPDKSSLLSNLGLSIRARFERLDELGDLELAISTHRHAVSLSPDGHPHKPSCLNTLGLSLRARFEHLGELGDLELAILTHRDAVDLTPDGHPHKPSRLNNLGLCFITRFDHLGELSDLEDAISTHRDAVDLTPDGHPDKATCLNNLGHAFITRFEHLGELSDLEHAILTHKNAIHLIPDGHPDKPTYLNNLGHCFVTRSERLGELSDLAHAITLYSRSASSPTGSIYVRFHASQKWVLHARRTRHPSLLHAYSNAINLLPQLAWVGLSLARRYAQLEQGADVVREAAAAALNSGFPERAVEWLEQGRSVVWGELLQLRSSYDQLSSSHADHARRLRELSVALDNAGAVHEQILSELSDSEGTRSAIHHGSLQHEADKHRALAIEREKVLQEIRRLPGFERFLLPKDFSQLRASAHSGPVVILNAAESRCDALVVLANVDHVIHVPLSNFTLQRATDLQGILKNYLRHAHAERTGQRERCDRGSWESFLAPLWKCIVEPIMDALAFSITAQEELSRIFWCPTGPFVFLPIHAAGLYDGEHSLPGHKVFDFAASSYTPTLSILAPSRNICVAPNNDLRLLAVRQPPTDGQSQLPGVHTELEYIKEIIRNSNVAFLESSVGTVEEVLGLMLETDWVHFACHGIQDATTATDSGLCLANRRRLKISDIIGLSRTRCGLAFLSACQTATGDKDLSDEAIHIAAGMLFAGYGGVIGSMWAISDRLAPIVAKEVYEYLFRNGARPDYREAAWALHEAIKSLRESGEVPFNEWVPFIHVGL